jgi:predicted O-methyltransferase YrrM
VETGTFEADGSLALAKGCALNGFGHVWTYELGAERAEAARQRIQAEGFAGYITVVNEDATTADWAGPPIELFFCDGGGERYKEILNFDPWFAPRCTVIAHDAADPQYQWTQLGDKYLPVILPSARGVWIMHKFGGMPLAGDSRVIP